MTKQNSSKPELSWQLCRWQRSQMWASQPNKGFTPAQMQLIKTATCGVWIVPHKHTKPEEIMLLFHCSSLMHMKWIGCPLLINRTALKCPASTARPLCNCAVAWHKWHGGGRFWTLKRLIWNNVKYETNQKENKFKKWIKLPQIIMKPHFYYSPGDRIFLFYDWFNDLNTL